jgi:DNA-directed RNA polymerase alpha subunit
MSRQFVYDLPLPSRTKNALVRACIYFGEDLRSRSRKELLVVSGIGPRGANQIEECLLRRGLLPHGDNTHLSPHEETTICAS